MGEASCEIKPGQACKNGAEIEKLKSRVQNLENEKEEEKSFRETYQSDREARIRRDAELDFKMKLMDEKLDKLISWQEAQMNKPNRLLDGLIEKGLWAIAAAVIAFLLAKVGIV